MAFDGTQPTTETYQTEEIPIPDMFRTEAPLVERNVRFDYLFTNHLEDPPADESQFFTEVSYAFTEQFGLIFAAPYLARDNFEAPNASGFGDVSAGLRYVLLGSGQQDRFKVALGFNVAAPTGDEDEELGEGQAVLEPELLTQYVFENGYFAQLQLSLGIPTESGNTTEFECNSGVGYLFQQINAEYFAYPAVIAELNGFSGVGGEDAGVTILDATTGLRWSMGKKLIAGVGASVPLTSERDFEAQFIFSLIYRYGVEPGEAVSSGTTAPTSRAYY